MSIDVDRLFYLMTHHPASALMHLANEEAVRRVHQRTLEQAAALGLGSK